MFVIYVSSYIPIRNEIRQMSGGIGQIHSLVIKEVIFILKQVGYLMGLSYFGEIHSNLYTTFPGLEG